MAKTRRRINRRNPNTEGQMIRKQAFHFDMSDEDEVIKYKALELMAAALNDAQVAHGFIRVAQALNAGHQIEVKPLKFTKDPELVTFLEEKDLEEIGKSGARGAKAGAALRAESDLKILNSGALGAVSGDLDDKGNPVGE